MLAALDPRKLDCPQLTAALLVLAAFQSTANIVERLVDMSTLGVGYRFANK